ATLGLGSRCSTAELLPPVMLDFTGLYGMIFCNLFKDIGLALFDYYISINFIKFLLTIWTSCSFRSDIILQYLNLYFEGLKNIKP
ncbi:MAG: hypothetical protein ACPLKS_06695, partial [Caldisericum exile]|uniref:hypothetical protein n=1 Tax=Caldisericum exile TaxID=693075 RepID=UPI003C76D93C